MTVSLITHNAIRNWLYIITRYTPHTDNELPTQKLESDSSAIPMCNKMTHISLQHVHKLYANSYRVNIIVQRYSATYMYTIHSVCLYNQYIDAIILYDVVNLV